MMNCFLKISCCSFVILLLTTQIPFAAGISSPLRHPGKLKPRAATGGAISVAGLDVLRTYVCPPCANTIRRQMDTKMAGMITVAIPVAEVSELWQELQWIFDQLTVILDAEGLLRSLTSSVIMPTVPASMIGTAMPAEVLLSASVDVSNPSTTNSFIPATTGARATTFASITLAGVPSGNVLEITDTAVGIAAPSTLSAAAATASRPLSTISSVIELQGTATNLETSSVSETMFFPEGAVKTQGSMCFVSQSVEETTSISHLDVTAFEAVATFTSSTASSTLVNASSSVIKSTPSLSAEKVSLTTSVSSGAMSTGVSSYSFNSQSTQNIAVYYGQSGATGETTLEAQCADMNIDITILAFVITSNFDGKYPDLNFGAACGGQTPEMMQDAPGLLSCPDLENYIDMCQQTYGKKVLLSIGGSTSSLSFASASDASDFANILWQLFGPPGSIDIELRPFGNVSVDGFDIDNEDKLPSYFDTFASTLRTNFASDISKTYYISSAPQCPFPDASDPLPMLLLCDFVYVQFYNNPPCEIGSSNFSESIQQWSTALTSSTLSPKPRLYLGAPAWSAAGYTAYQAIGSAEGMEAIAKSVVDLQLVNFGGVMFWDGSEAVLNTEGGKDILGWAKAGLAQ